MREELALEGGNFETTKVASDGAPTYQVPIGLPRSQDAGLAFFGDGRYGAVARPSVRLAAARWLRTVCWWAPRTTDAVLVRKRQQIGFGAEDQDLVGVRRVEGRLQRTGQHYAVQPAPGRPVGVGLVVFDPRAPHSVPEPTRFDILRMLGERACTERR